MLVTLVSETGQKVTGSGDHRGAMTNTTEVTTANSAADTGGYQIPDPRPAFAAAVALGRQTVAGVRPDQLDDSTPCNDFDVRTLGRHILAVLERLVIVGAGGDPADSPDFVEGVADGEWLAAYDAFTDRINAVWSDEVLTNIVTVPWAKLPGAIALLIYINEMSVHTWDLATATGQTPAWDPQVLETAYAAIQFGLPAEGRDNPELPFGEVVEVPADAPLIDKLVAWNGRQPR
jgi:uncharacterized protein (TIGR03086 family)